MTDDHPQSPAEALAAIRDSRTAVVDRMSRVHWSYDLAYGLICGVIVGGQGLPQPFGILSVSLSLCALAVMVRVFQKQTGVWVSGVSPPRARWVAFGLGAVLLGLVLASLILTRVMDHWWPSLAVGAVAGLVAVAASRLWMRVYRREMAEEGA